MSFNLTDMSEALKNLQPMKQIIFDDDIIAEWKQIPSVSNYAELSYVSSDASWTSNSSCSNFSGTTNVSITDKKVQICDVKNETGLCKKTLAKTWIGNNLSFLNGKGLEPYEQLIKDVIIEPLIEAKKKSIFVGTPGATSCSGLFYQLSGDSARITDTTYSGTTGYALTYSNAITVIDSYISNIPEKMTNSTNLKMYMSYAQFRTFIRKVRDTGNRYFAPEVYGKNKNRFMYAGAGAEVEIVATHALIGDNRIIIADVTRLYNIFTQSSVTTPMELWYDINSQQVRYRATAAYVPAYVSADEIVCNF